MTWIGLLVVFLLVLPTYTASAQTPNRISDQALYIGITPSAEVTTVVSLKGLTTYTIGPAPSVVICGQSCGGNGCSNLQVFQDTHEANYVVPGGNNMDFYVNATIYYYDSGSCYQLEPSLSTVSATIYVPSYWYQDGYTVKFEGDCNSLFWGNWNYVNQVSPQIFLNFPSNCNAHDDNYVCGGTNASYVNTANWITGATGNQAEQNTYLTLCPQIWFQEPSGSLGGMIVVSALQIPQLT